MAELATKYQQYAEYKDSGVEWLGDIPKDWKLKRIQELTNVINGYPFESSKFNPIKGMPLVRIRDIRHQKTEVCFDGTVPEFAVINDGDILIGMDGDFNVAKWTGGKAALNQRVACIRHEDPMVQSFLYYLLPYNMKVVNDLTYYTTVKHLSTNDILKTTFAIPCENELGSIVSFLDHETAQIDNLIEKQQSLIQLLKEKRQAVISHAVTKGLNPDAPMKDSGVEWLGDVPEHWEVTRIKYITSMFEQGWSPQCDSRPAESNEYGVLKVGCVNYGSFHSIENKALPPELKPRLQYLIKKGDLLISRANTKELVGSAAVVDTNYDNLLLCDKLYRLRFNSNIQPDLIALYLSIELVREQIELQASGASHSMQNISQDVIKELPCFLLPNEEAHELLKSINEKMKVFDSLVMKAQQAIQLMQERRTALISAAVTGKIDVRGWQAAEQS